MKKFPLLIVLCLFVWVTAYGQNRHGLYGRHFSRNNQDSEGWLSLTIGPGVLLGDAGSPYRNTFVDGWHNFNTGLGFRQKLEDGFSYKVNLDYGNYSETDAGSYLAYRNYSGISNVIQFWGRAEYSLYFGGRYDRTKPHSVYVFAGLGGLGSFTAYTGKPQLSGEQITPAFGTFIPLGVGYQYDLENGFAIGLEYSYQYALTDYVDGFHSKRYSRSNDVLMHLKFTVSYKIF